MNARGVAKALENYACLLPHPDLVRALRPMPPRGGVSFVVDVPALPRLGPVHETRVRLSAWWCLWWRWCPWLPVVPPQVRVWKLPGYRLVVSADDLAADGRESGE